MPKKPEVVIHWERLVPSSGIFAGLTVQEARDILADAKDTGQKVEVLVEAYKKKKTKK